MAVDADYSFIDLELKLASGFVPHPLVVDAGGVSEALIDTDEWTRAAVPAEPPRDPRTGTGVGP